MSEEFRCIRLDNFKFNHSELVEYFRTVEEKYQHLCWNINMAPEVDKPAVEWYTRKGIAGKEGWRSWSVMGRFHDNTKPQPAWRLGNPPGITEGDFFNTPTELMFGFAKKLYDAIPDMLQLSLTSHPPGGSIEMHSDNDDGDVTQNLFTVHLPIQANDWSLWEWADKEPENLEVGHAYALNTVALHGTHNHGNTERIHLWFRIHMDKLDEFVNTVYDFT